MNEISEWQPRKSDPQIIIKMLTEHGILRSEEDKLPIVVLLSLQKTQGWMARKMKAAILIKIHEPLASFKS